MALRTAASATVLALVATGTACSSGSTEAPPRAPSATSKLSSLLCPSLSGESEARVAELFGVDASMAARLDRARRLAAELEETRAALERRTSEVCARLARDLGGPSDGAASATPPCSLAAARLDALRARLGAGARLTVAVRGAACGVSKEALGRCAGECLTGDASVTSAVVCEERAGGLCAREFDLPDAGPACRTRCAARALRLATCSAEVDVRVEGGAEAGDAGAGDEAAIASGLEALRRDLPELVALAVDLAPRARKLAGDVAVVVDDLAVAIDALASRAPDGRRAAVGASVAVCFAPTLGAAVRASQSLEAAVVELGPVSRAVAAP